MRAVAAALGARPLRDRATPAPRVDRASVVATTRASPSPSPRPATDRREPSSSNRGAIASSTRASRQQRNPDDWGGDYDKIREELMSRGPSWAENLPGISNTINWLSQNTFGASAPSPGTRSRKAWDAIALAYRAFLDALPYRRQDGRAARALPKGRVADAHVRWEAFKRGDGASELSDDARRELLDGEAECAAFWRNVAEDGAAAAASRKRAKTVGGVGLSAARDASLAMTERQVRAITGDVMGLALSLRVAAAKAKEEDDANAAVNAAANTNANANASGANDDDDDDVTASASQTPALVDASADEVGDYRDELLSGWGGGGNAAAFVGGFGAITASEAREATASCASTPADIASRVLALSGLLLCTPTEAIAVAHVFPAILETPRSVIAQRMAALKELVPRADAAVIFRAEPRLLLAGDGDVIMANARRSVAAIKSQLPGVNADKLVEQEPSMMFEDISEELEALRELWPEEAFRNSDEQNPFFAEELALAIKALQGKGKEKPFKSL
jgi:hypothetical protein